MSHEFETGFFVREPAWHGLGTVLSDTPQTSEEAIKLAGLDWKVEKQPMYLLNGDQVPNSFAMVREVDGSVLGTVGNRYTILQNNEAFDFFDPIIQNKVAEYETAGSLLSGKRVWILAKLTGDIELTKDDVVKKYVLLSSTHDGSGSVIAKTTGVRVVCNNTLTMALHSNKDDEVRIRHTKSVADKVKSASELLTSISSKYDDATKVWKGMMKVQMPPTAVVDYFKTVFPDSKDAKNPYKTQLKRAEVFQLLENTSLGGTLEGSLGTLWGSYNAVTAYADHMVSARKGASAEKHLESVWFGNKYKEKDRAFQAAIDIMIKEGVSLDL